MSSFKLSAKRRALLDVLLKEKGVDSSPIERISRRNTSDPVPLSFAQARLWFLDELMSGSSLFNISTALRLKGSLNVAAFEQSLNEIIKRHEALRTNVVKVDGQPFQAIAPTSTLTLSVVNLQEFPEVEREAEVLRLAREEAQRPFNLERDRLLRATLLRLNETDHVVLFTIHHLVSDDWSIGILIRELTALYETFNHHQPSPLPELPIQYPDFALWQQQWLQGDVFQNQLSYWKQQLGGHLPILQFPTDYPRPAVATFRGASQSFSLTAELTEALKALSQKEDATLFMILLAAFKTLLYRYTGSEDVVVGSPIANRNRVEIEGLIGCFVNTLVLRTDLSGNLTFRALLRRVREVTLGAYAHQDLPFEKLVEELQPERNLSYTPLFQVMFVMQDNVSMSALELSGLTWNALDIDNDTTKFDLTLRVTEVGGRLVGTLEYSTDLFDAETITRITGHLQTLLEGIVANPDQPLSTLPLLTSAEQQQLLAWNQTQADCPVDVCLHELFEAQVEQTPDAVAVVFENQQLTYRELNQRANQLAHYLQQLGVEPEVLVGLCVDRSLEMVIGILGILKAGGAYVPLDPTYPQERLAFMLEDAQVSVLLTQKCLLTAIPENRATVVCLDADWESIQVHDSIQTPQSKLPNPSSLAYVIYTSGSTGKPKGVLVSHANVVRLFQATQSWYHFNERDVWTLFHSYAFDFSVWELWGALLYGGRLVIVPYWVSREPQAFYNLLCKEQVTVLNQTPSAFRQLIRVEESLGTSNNLCLRWVIFGGEALELQSLKPWFERHGDKSPQLVNMYGITETTVHVTYRPITVADLNQTGSVIGNPIPDLQVYVLDKHVLPVPIGVAGELYVGGAGVARGYLNRPELTAERFMLNPFSDNPEARLYKTGDLVRYLPNGDIEYLGRIDQQVKVRGFRIELGEIEAALGQHPSVGEAVVLVREDSPGDKQLVAYVVPKAEQALTVGELRRFLREMLPEYMVPSAFVMLDALPLTLNGKVDRRALPVPNTARPELDEAFVAPRTPEEQILADIWKQILGLERVGIYDNFFALGGDSIRSIQVQSLAQKQGLNFSLQQLFQHQTIDELVREIVPGVDSSATQERVQPFSLISQDDRGRLPDSVEDAYPLARLQAGMIFHSEYNRGSAIYHDIFSYHLQAPLDRQALHRAIQQIVNRHPVLRTSFALTGFSEPLQLVHHSVEVPLQVEDLRHLSPAEQEAALNAWIEAEKNRPFDWTRPPLIRFQVHHRTEETFQLTLSFHHAILDGWSVASMLTELCEYLLLRREDEGYQASSTAIAFRDFVALEQNAIASEECQHYWTQKLTDSTVTMLPRWRTLHPATNLQQSSRRKDVPLSSEVSEGLKQLAKLANVPLKSVLLAAHLRVLSVLSNQSDVLTGLVSNGRPENTDGEQILGLFLNTLPFRLNLSESTWIDLARETFQAECELLPFRRYPLAEIQRHSGGQPLFDTAFNFIHFHVYRDVLGRGDIQVLDGTFFEETNLTLLANFSVDPSSSLIYLSLNCQADALCDEQIEAIGGYYARTLAVMVNQPFGQFADHSLLSTRERQQLLVEWNKTEADYPQYNCLHQLFEAQVERTPDRVAVVFENKQLTYRELNQRANQLARHLQKLGVKSEVLVGICVERSLEMLIGILGILKAGAAYVPLDPAYPQERLAFMLEDAQVSVLLTQQRLLERLPEHRAEIVCLDAGEIIQANDCSLIENSPPQPPLPRGEYQAQLLSLGDTEQSLKTQNPSNLAYVIYTSGSTGKPKGVQISHRALVNFLCSMRQTPGLTEQDVLLAVTTLSFDIAGLELYLPLIVGARVVIASREVAADGIRLSELLTHSSATVMQATPATWRLLLAAGWQGKKPLKILCGGEALSRELANQLLTRCDSLWNLYGPTETTIWSTIHQVKSEDGLVPIGSAIANTQLYILDHRLQPTPVGVPGELYIGGAGVARGYLNRPELTAERFISNPFSDQPEARLYKTEDLARYLPNGDIEYLGRIDHQVKIRGFRIELGEIETALAQYPSVEQAVVVAREDSPGLQRLVAYIVPCEEQTLDLLHKSRRPLPSPPLGKGREIVSPLDNRSFSEEGLRGVISIDARSLLKISELRDFLKKQLPDYMIPSAFVLLSALPLTPNGKVDRRALPAPDATTLAGETVFVAPRTPVEEVLTNLWTEILNLERVGIHDNFFELGGHSLLATQLISRIRDTFQVELPLRCLFESPTVAELSDRIEATRQTELEQQIPHLVPVSRSEELPLSFAQARLWFLDRIAPGNCAYNIPAAVRLTGALNLQALQQSLNDIVRRHEALRTTFVMGNEQPIQVITPSLTLPLPIVDLRELPKAEQEAEIQQLAIKEAQQPFDLERDPLLRVTLLQLGETEHIVLLTMHHIVSDGWSMGVLVREVAALYESFSCGKPSPLPELPIQYADFAVWQRQWLLQKALDAQLSYWKQHLAGAPTTLNLPTDRARPAVQTFRGATSRFVLPKDLSSAICASQQRFAIATLSRQEGVTLFMLLLAAFQTLLHRYTNQDDIVVGTDVANRNRSEVEPLIGFFVNLLVLRTDLSGNPSFRELLRRVREVTLGAYAHQDLPFAKLVEALSTERNLNHTPLFQVLFVLQNAPMPSLELSGLTLTPIDIETGTAKFDLALFMEETEQGIIGTWNYSTDLFDASTITRMSGHFETLLGNIVKHPDTPIKTVEMLSESEKQQQILEQEQRKKAKFNKFKSVKPKAVSLPQGDLVKTDYLSQGETLPLVVQPTGEDIDFVDWAKSDREFIETQLLKHGAILFRGFNINSATEFETVAQAICPELFGEYGDLPREGVGGKVYGSTPYPADKAILFHNESSHLQRFPLKIWFFCVQPAQQGGETPIVDCRKMYQLLDPKVREQLASKQLIYVRNYIEGLDVSWQDFFRTTDKAVVEEYCSKAGINFEWLPENGLRTRQVRPAIAKHPKTGELVFFNQIQLHHVSFLDSAVRDSLLSLFGEEKLPRNVYYGDGSPLEESVIQEITEIYQRSQVSFSWQKGDILMLDNMLTAHGRNPYVGSRKIVVAMGEMINL